jgi:bifunctional DNA-binding transcriptional regulator/antitoxin component of YhaV-PrlF toxin-antitoxin module
MGVDQRFTCKMDHQGRIMLPATWRRKQGLGPNAELLVEIRDHSLVLQTRDQAVREAQEIVRKRIPAGKSLVEDLRRERQREALVERTAARTRSRGGRRRSDLAMAGGSRVKRNRGKARP